MISLTVVQLCKRDIFYCGIITVDTFNDFLVSYFIVGASAAPEAQPRPMQPVIVHPEMDIDVSRPATPQRHIS